MLTRATPAPSCLRCATCAAPHMAMVARGFYGRREVYMVIETRQVFCADTGLLMATLGRTSDFQARRVLRIVLAAVWPDTCADAAPYLCQRHRPRALLDDDTKARAARTRRGRNGQIDLEDLL